MNDSLSILKKYWGHSAFRPAQEAIIDAVLAKKDVLALLPTGGGKSVCFQVPAMQMEGLCLVISPLIALMKDQVENLSRKGIPALSIYSGMPFFEVKKNLQNAAFGNYKFLYISPERLETNLFKEFLPAIKPSLIAVDEAHCISQWGYDFRPSYLRIRELRAQLPGVPVIALTASATRDVQEDICQQLLFTNDRLVFRQTFARPNLSYSVFEPEAKQTRLLEILAGVKGSAIVYCKSRKKTFQLAALLHQHGYKAAYYHAGLSNEERSQRQSDWIQNNPGIIVCTNAFGMGIDKPDVRVVIHFDVPENLENYYQEAGRAGRDGKKAYAVLLCDRQETDELYNQASIRYPEPGELKHMYTALMNFLQVPAGIGEGQSFIFDLAAFADAFKLNILKATYGIQALASEGILEFAETAYKPSTLVFNCTKEALYDFEQRFPLLEPLIKGLLRNYEGIFDQPSVIYESLLAKFVRQNPADCRNQLAELHRHGIVDYNPSSDQPRISLLLNRMYNDDFRFDYSKIEQRKQKYLQRLQAMEAYCKETKQCRSKLIASYFDDNQVADCGICDNCINNREQKIAAAEVQEISKLIMNKLQVSALPLETFKKSFPQLEEQKLWMVVEFLQAEDKIRTDKEGTLHLSKR